MTAREKADFIIAEIMPEDIKAGYTEEEFMSAREEIANALLEAERNGMEKAANIVNRLWIEHPRAGIIGPTLTIAVSALRQAAARLGKETK